MVLHGCLVLCSGAACNNQACIINRFIDYSVLLWQLRLQKPFPWDQQVVMHKSLQQPLAGVTGGR